LWVLSSAPGSRYGPGMYLGAIPGDPDEVIVSTNDPDMVTVWMGASGATDLTREAAEDLAALLMRAVRAVTAVRTSVSAAHSRS
jgi:hypothetical protein